MTDPVVPLPEPKVLRCHKCRSTELTVYETCHEHGTFPGPVLITPEGNLFTREDGLFNPGEIQPKLTRIGCDNCGHEWHPRRTFDGVIL